MAHLIVIESWVGAVGLIMPHKLKKYGHTYTFIARNPEHYTEWAGNHGMLNDQEFQGKHPIIGMAENVLELETNNTESLIRFLKEYRKVHPFDGVLTCCDYYLQTAAEVAEALNLPGPSAQSMRLVNQKHLMREAVRNANLPSPKFNITDNVSEAGDFAAQVGYPVVVKAVDLCASEHVFAVENQEELTEAFEMILQNDHNIREQRRSGMVLVEEFLKGEEFSVETISFEGQAFVVGVTDKSLTGYPSFIESGVMHPAEMGAEQKNILEQFVVQVLSQLNYSHGLAHTEVKMTDQGPRIIEINPRMGGSYLFELVEKVTGIDQFKVMIDLALGIPPQMFHDQTEVNSAAIRFVLPPSGGRIAEIQGIKTIQNDPHVDRIVIDDLVGETVRSPQDNNDFIGHILTVDSSGFAARHYAEKAAEHLNVVMDKPCV